jgi:hypothetical protein
MKKTFIIETNMTIATAKVGSFQLTIPDTGQPVVLKRVQIQTDVGPLAYSLLEDYSFVAAGSVITPLNINRILGGASRVVVKSIADTTAVAGGSALTINSLKVGAGNTLQLRMGSTDVVLKPGKYLIAVTNSNAGNAIVNFNIAWEE